MQKKQEIINSGIDLEEPQIYKLKKLIILIFPFATFLGSYINILGLNISNVYSVVLLIFLVQSLIKKRLENIISYISFFFLMILYALFSMIWGRYSDVGITIIMPLMTGFVAMAFIASFNERELKFFVKSLSFFTIFILIVSVYEIFTGNYLFFDNIDFIYRKNDFEFNYPGVVFANPNDLAQYLVVGFPLLMFSNFQQKKLLIPTLFVLFMTFFVLVNTSSRLSLICAVIIIISYFIFSAINKAKNKINMWFFTFLLIMIVVILNILNIGIGSFNIFDNFLKVNSSEAYFLARETIYYQVFDLGLNNLIFGAGLGGSYTVASIPPHNLFLFIFADLGIGFTIGFIIYLAKGVFSLYRFRNFKVLGYDLNKIVLSILLAFPMLSSMSSGNEQRKVVWMLFGLILVLIKYNKRVSKNIPCVIEY